MTTTVSTTHTDKLDPRAEYVAGLRALANILEQHPDLDVPLYGTRYAAIRVVLTGDPGQKQRDQLAAWARALPGQKTKRPGGSDATMLKLMGQLHGLYIDVLCDRDEVCERVVVGTHEVVEEVPDPDALAAVPKVTVTKTVEDVRWECRPILAETPESAGVR